MKARSVFNLVAAAMLIILFVYTAASKLMDIKEFKGSINNQPFDNRFTILFLIGLPFFEFLATAFLFFAKTQLYGFILSALMMTVFTGYIALILLGFYSRIPCSCGGVIKQLTWTQHLLFNLFFLILAITGALFEWKNKKAGRPQQNIAHIK
jgi:putative oxidoreductase